MRSVRIAAWIFLAAHCAARAQTPSPMPEWEYSAGELLRVVMEPELPVWSVLASVSTEYLPRYDGARGYHSLTSPTFDARYRDVAFASSGEGLGVNLLHTRTYRAGLAMSYDLGRPERESARLKGLGNVDPCAEAKLYAEYLAFPVMLRIDARKALGGYQGWIGDAGVYLPVYGTDRFFVLTGPSVTFADATYMQHFFGITASQSGATGYAPYAPGGGMKSASAAVDVTWLITDEWLVNGILAGDRLLRNAKASPLTEQSEQYTASLTVGYQF